jgi:hypothetical protein
MDNMNTILNELKSISPAVANISKENVYTIPTGYFEKLPAHIISYVTANETDTIAKSTLPFSVPGNYFENLTAKIISNVKRQRPVANEISAELESIAPLLNTISKREIYSLPGNYFNELDIKPKKTGKLISLVDRGNKLVRYAVAAVVAGIMVTGGIALYDKESSPSATASISNYKPEEVKSLSDDEIIEFLSVNSSSADVTANSTIENQPDDISNSLQEMSDQEIKQYLQENAEPEETYSKEG